MSGVELCVRECQSITDLLRGAVLGAGHRDRLFEERHGRAHFLPRKRRSRRGAQLVEPARDSGRLVRREPPLLLAPRALPAARQRQCPRALLARNGHVEGEPSLKGRPGEREYLAAEVDRDVLGIPGPEPDPQTAPLLHCTRPRRPHSGAPPELDPRARRRGCIQAMTLLQHDALHGHGRAGAKGALAAGDPRAQRFVVRERVRDAHDQHHLPRSVGHVPEERLHLAFGGEAAVSGHGERDLPLACFASPREPHPGFEAARHPRLGDQPERDVHASIEADHVGRAGVRVRRRGIPEDRGGAAPDGQGITRESREQRLVVRPGDQDPHRCRPADAGERRRQQDPPRSALDLAWGPRRVPRFRPQRLGLPARLRAIGRPHHLVERSLPLLHGGRRPRFERLLFIRRELSAGELLPFPLREPLALANGLSERDEQLFSRVALTRVLVRREGRRVPAERDGPVFTFVAHGVFASFSLPAGPSIPDIRAAPESSFRAASQSRWRCLSTAASDLPTISATSRAVSPST